MIRQFIMSMEDNIPVAFNWARYLKHVVINKAVTYPLVLGPIFGRMGSNNLVAIDVGANVGVFTRYLSRKFGEVHAIEPIPHLAKRLQTVAPKKVTVHNCAVGTENGEVIIRTPLDALGGRMDALSTAAGQNDFELFGHSGSIETVFEQRKLSTLVTSERRIGFVKIDVEGFENEVLRGSTELIARHQPLLLIEIGKVHNSKFMDTLELIESFGYVGFSISNDGLTDDVEKSIRSQPTDLKGVPQSKWHGQWDFLFVPRAAIDLVEPFLQKN